MAPELAWRLQRRVARRQRVAERDGTDRRLDRLARRAAGTQQGVPVGREIEHCRFKADEGRPTIEDQLHPVAERFRHMLGACRANSAAAIGRGSGDRPADSTDQTLRH